MRIGFDAKRAFHTARGLGSYARTTLTYLSRMYPQHQFILFTPPIKKGKLDQWHVGLPNIVVVEPKSLIFRAIPSLWRSFFLSGEIKKYQLDIFHGLSHELPIGIEKLGIKTVVTIHDLIYVKFPHFFNFIDRYIFEKKFSSSIKRSDRVIAICEQTKKDIVDHFGCPHGKISVVYQSCHPRFFTPLEEGAVAKARDVFQLPERYLLFLGALVPNKNIELVFQALSRFPVASRPHFVIAGKPSSHLSALRKMVSDLQIESHVHWVFSPDDSLLPALYAGADFFCFPSFYEGFGIPLIEALCMGSPVITSKQGALKEAAGEGGLFIDPSSVEECFVAIEKLWNDSMLRHALSENGKKHLLHFSAEQVTADLMKQYQLVVESTAL